MNIALPILLLVFGGLTFWILNESKLKWYLKTACITTFCLFTIIFWTSIHTFLGWPADEEDMPNKILIHWVIVKEPNKFEEFDGGIFILLETMEELKANRVARKLRSGMVDINGAGLAPDAPFGGYKHSGIGREAGVLGLEEYLEVKAVSGWNEN